MLGRQLKTPLNKLQQTPTKTKVTFDPSQISEKQGKTKTYTDRRRHARKPSYSSGDRVQTKVQKTFSNNPRSETRSILKQVAPATYELDNHTRWNSVNIRPDLSEAKKNEPRTTIEERGRVQPEAQRRNLPHRTHRSPLRLSDYT